MIICCCKKIRKEQVMELIKTGFRDRDSLTKNSGAGSGCGTCVGNLDRLLESLDTSTEVPEKGNQGR